MTVFDGNNPRFHFTVMTADGRWMVAHEEGGKPVVDTTFVGSSADAMAIAAVWNRRELDFYQSENLKAIEMKRPTLADIAEFLGVKI